MKLATIAIVTLLATAAQAQDTRVWTVETPKGGDAWLRYATPQMSDQVAAFRCVPKSGQVQVLVRLEKALTARIPLSVTLTSAPASATLRGVAEPNPGSGGSIAATEFSTRAPVVAAFKRTGVIGVTALGETLALPAAPKSAVRKFFGACK